MKTLFKTLITTIILVFSCTSSGVTFVLDESNVFVDGVIGAVVDIRPGTDDGVLNGDIDFRVSVFVDSFTYADVNNFGMQSFSFNYDLRVFDANGDTGVVLDGTNLEIINIDPIGWNVKNTPNNVSEFGTFDIDIKGTGHLRTLSLFFSITGVEGDIVDNYAINFASHIAGFEALVTEENYGVTSAYFYGEGNKRDLPPVPVPPAVWLFGSGLIGLIAVGRRKV